MLLKSSDYIQREFEDLKRRIGLNLDNTNTTTTGFTKSSLRNEYEYDNGVNTYTLYGRKYFGTVETGRKPGKIPFDFVETLLKWIDDKGLVPREIIPYKREASEKWQPKYTPLERAKRKMAGAIAFTTKTKGSYLFRKGGREDIFTNEIAETLKRLNVIYPSIITAELTDIIKKEYEQLNTL